MTYFEVKVALALGMFACCAFLAIVGALVKSL